MASYHNMNVYIIVKHYSLSGVLAISLVAGRVNDYLSRDIMMMRRRK